MTAVWCDGQRSTGSTGLLAALLLIWIAVVSPALGDPALSDEGPRVSDVVAGISYCKGFGSQVETVEGRQPVHLDAIIAMIHEGQAQCAAGHIKSGMHLLRMALSQLSGG